MPEKYATWSLERIERELLDAQQEHDRLVAESSERIRALMAARDAKLAGDDRVTVEG